MNPSADLFVGTQPICRDSANDLCAASLQAYRRCAQGYEHYLGCLSRQRCLPSDLLVALDTLLVMAATAARVIVERFGKQCEW